MSALWMVVPAAGSGSRMALSQPKQFMVLEGRSLLEWSLLAVLAEPRIKGCMVALPTEQAQFVDSMSIDDPRLAFCAGGATRADSVAAAISALQADDDDWVLVHDAARPCLSPVDLARLIDRVLEAGHGGLLAQPLTDTLKKSDGAQRVDSTIDREGLWRAQTPQMFPVGDLSGALRAAQKAGVVITDEASAMEYAGYEVLLVEGSSVNLKVTYPEDVKIAKLWLSETVTIEPHAV